MMEFNQNYDPDANPKSLEPYQVFDACIVKCAEVLDEVAERNLEEPNQEAVSKFLGVMAKGINLLSCTAPDGLKELKESLTEGARLIEAVAELNERNENPQKVRECLTGIIEGLDAMRDLSSDSVKFAPDVDPSKAN